MSSFALEKWYLDVVTEAGDAAILYCATLRWSGLRLEYGSLLTLTGSEARQKSALAGYRVQQNAEQIHVEIPRLQVRGLWSRQAEPHTEVVYEEQDGAVLWECLQPRAQVELCVGRQMFSGLGYGERLTVTVLPWKLPLTQLQWGRSIGREHSCVWMDWRGPYAKSIAWVNGERRALLNATETELVLEGARLNLSDARALRAGQLGETVLPGLPALGNLLPQAIFGVMERKWCSCGQLDLDGQQSEGWAVHEVVDWKH